MNQFGETASVAVLWCHPEITRFSKGQSALHRLAQIGVGPAPVEDVGDQGNDVAWVTHAAIAPRSDAARVFSIEPDLDRRAVVEQAGIPVRHPHAPVLAASAAAGPVVTGAAQGSPARR